MGVALDIHGQTFGHLTALSVAGRNVSGQRTWRCRCDCGKRIVTAAASLKSGHARSCGCTRAESHKTHGLSKAPEYWIWASMRQRCENVHYRTFRWYGARGIKVCARWNSFALFIQDMGRRPHKGLTIQRIDNDGDYKPSNCTWATWKEQQANKRRGNKWTAQR